MSLTLSIHRFRLHLSFKRELSHIREIHNAVLQNNEIMSGRKMCEAMTKAKSWRPLLGYHEVGCAGLSLSCALSRLHCKTSVFSSSVAIPKN
jgi:hypothetical protein